MKKLFNFFSTRFHLSYYILLLSKNWVNLFLTFYVNFKFLPFNQAIKFPIYIYNKTKFFTFNGKIILNAKKVTKGMIRIGQTNDSPCTSGGGTEIINYSTIIFKGKATIGCGCRIVTYNNGRIVFGHNFKMQNKNLIGCCNSIVFGNSVSISHQVQIFDTDFHFLYNLKTKKVKGNNKAVFIGNNCWICNRVSIMKGVSIPNYTTVCSNSLLNRDYIIPEGSILAGIPAKHLNNTQPKIRIWNNEIENRLYNYFEQNEDTEFSFIDDISIEDITKI